jgi:sulfite dehydrogenase (quinone) subunit SoeA
MTADPLKPGRSRHLSELQPARTSDRFDVSPVVSDEVKCSICYMCACRCGIQVHLTDGKVRYIQGNRRHPVNRGVLCAKGSAGIMQHYSPARLRKPLRRVGERGRGEFEEIEWDEALEIAGRRLAHIRATDPRKLAFFTGRDQSQALTGWWASQFGTPNYAAHGGFCSVNMAAAGIYTIGGSFWEFGEPDWEHTRYCLMFGVAEDHDSNPIKIGLGLVKSRGAKFVSVNPVQTGYSAIADEWLGIVPGTDGLFVAALIHELLRAGRIDVDYLLRYTNACWLVVQDPGGPQDGLFARDSDGRPLCWDSAGGTPAWAHDTDARPALKGRFTLPDGRVAVPAFELLARHFSAPDYSPDAVAARTGIEAPTIRRIAAELAQAAFDHEITIDQPWTDWQGRRHEQMIGRPVSMHAMRGIAAHTNGFHTCRAIHVLQILLGSIDVPGGHRYKPPYPKSAECHPRPAGHTRDIGPDTCLPGPPLGLPMQPADLLVEVDGTASRIDKAYSWEAPLAAHGMMHMVITNAWKGDPYEIDTLFFYMANMAWNSAMNTVSTIAMLTDKKDDGSYRIPFIIVADAYASETVAYADLVLPDTTYLERWDCISLLDRPSGEADAACDAIRQPVVAPDRDVRPFHDVLIELGVRLGLPGLVTEDGSARFPGGYADYMINHERKPGIGPLAGWRGQSGEAQGRGGPNPDQLDRYIDNECFWRHEFAPEERYYKHANKAYLETAVRLGFTDSPEPVILQLYCEPLQNFRLAARGHGDVQPPPEHAQRLERYFDPLPLWYPPFEDGDGEDGEPGDFPLHAVTQRPMAMYHSWGSQNAWLRQIHSFNRLFVPAAVAASAGIDDDDWVWLTSRTGRSGRVHCQVTVMAGVNASTVWTWNAIGKRAGAWGLDPAAPEATRGFLLNHLIDELLPDRGGYRYSNSDPVTGQAAWYDLRLRLEKADRPSEVSEPVFPTLHPLPGQAPRPQTLRYGAQFHSHTGDGR